MDQQSHSPPSQPQSQPQSQSRPRKRPRNAHLAEAGNTNLPVSTSASAGSVLAWGSVAPSAGHHQTVRGITDTVPSPQPPTFHSQQLDRAEATGLMNLSSYSPSVHSPYPDSATPLGPSAQQQSEIEFKVNGLNGMAADASPASNQRQPHQQHQRNNTASSDRSIFHQYTTSAAVPSSESSPATGSNSAPPATPYHPTPAWPSSSMPPPASPSSSLAPPPEGIYRSFDDLLAAVQKVAKDQGYGVVKLRASNYRDGKPTRYDLVCDRGGVKYSSTAKKRNPSTRKVDCPWRAKAVCEVNLGMQWRFAVQEGRHNHEPRVPSAMPGQENTPTVQTLRSLTNKLDRLSHDQAMAFDRLASRLDAIEGRLEALESGRPSMMGGNSLGGNAMTSNGMNNRGMNSTGISNTGMGNNGMANSSMANNGMTSNSMSVSAMAGNSVPTMGNPGIPTANMGGGPLTNGGMGAGGQMVDSRLGSVEARLNVIEGRSMDSIPIMDEEPSRLMVMNP